MHLPQRMESETVWFAMSAAHCHLLTIWFERERTDDICTNYSCSNREGTGPLRLLSLD